MVDNNHQPNDPLISYFHQSGAIWGVVILVWGHWADCSLFVSHFSLYEGAYRWALSPGGLLVVQGRGVEVGSKVTKSISSELLRASSIVTYCGSLLPPFVCHTVGFLSSPSKHTDTLARTVFCTVHIRNHHPSHTRTHTGLAAHPCWSAH